MSQDPTPAHAEQLLEQITASWGSQALYVAAELGLADRLKTGPRGSTELAAELKTDAEALRRLLRALCTLDICRELDSGAFELTALGACLQEDAPYSLRGWARWWGSQLWADWGGLLYSVNTGKSARKLRLSTEGFDHLGENSPAASIFHKALAELTHLLSARVLRAWDFSKCTRVVDVGGGYGELLIAVLRAHPQCKGELLEQPHAMEGAKTRIAAEKLTGRCSFSVGDFFTRVPHGADAYLLKSVLHDWNDERALQILRCCRAALTGTARLLVVERMLPSRLQNTPEHRATARSDLTMLVAHAAQERSHAQLAALLMTAGLKVESVHDLGQGHALIEAAAA